MDNEEQTISLSVIHNIEALRNLFGNNEQLTFHYFERDGEEPFGAIAYLKVLIDTEWLQQLILPRIGERIQWEEASTNSLIDAAKDQGITRVVPNLEDAVRIITDAGIVLFAENQIQAFGMSLPGFGKRSIKEPMMEVNVRGPRAGFIEDLDTNAGLIYRRLKTPQLKSKTFIVGQESRTNIMVLYLENQVNLSVLHEIESRLESVCLNVVVDSAQIEEWIQDSVYSPFSQIQNTERPDRVATALNQGKVAILTDGSPNVLLAPAMFTDFLHPSEDLYEKFYFADFLRGLRIITLFVSLFLPSVYIALSTFHLEMIPTPLMLTFLSAKSGIPFPTILEALIMEIAFEILREASVRLPQTVGQSISIVGALIIGEAAVQSGIVSRSMVIIVAVTGIASFTIPSFNTAITLRLLRFPLMFIAACTGVLGISLSMFALVLHLCSLRSFGTLFIPTPEPKHWRDFVSHFVLLPIKLRKFSKMQASAVAAKGSEHDEEV
ncbi:spore germination protein [Paenibacillus sp. CGMCC 1.16610]|uniref:Spore germination protein n=1 Tax=Paenibacillus anseongense TaxID=2682845 RepID=A0ABW9ULP0_9BACL|nr:MULTISPECIES: spore germination protein [Paenibacillus]MBA2939770.1 spore germination protein [Paenibacillus sp. CGMCC 1.16610]MVQ39430.1 spore germination protein [Paenibacillus anseongense]